MRQDFLHLKAPENWSLETPWPGRAPPQKKPLLKKKNIQKGGAGGWVGDYQISTRNGTICTDRTRVL